nr:hypothetical protein [Tanacetum cinerariifolium]
MSSLFADTHNVVAILEKSDAAEADVTRLQSLVDKKKIVISEAVIREILQLDDAEGVVYLPNEEIFAGLAQMGYEKPSKFYMYPRFIQLIIQNQVGDFSTHSMRFISPALTQKVFANMRRVRKGFSGVEKPLFEGMLVARPLAEEQVQADDVPAAAVEENVAEDKLEIIKLQSRVKRLEKANKGRMIVDMDKDEGIELVKDADIAKTEGRHATERAEKQVEIYNLDLDHSFKVLISAASTTISAVKPSIPVAALTVVATYTRRRKGVIIRYPEEELSLKTPAETPKVKDKGKCILVETPKPVKKKEQIELDAGYARKLHEEINRDHEEFNKDIDWDATMDQVNQKSKNPQYIKRYQGIKKRPQTESEAHKNMMIYLKNTAGYKMDFFKGMTYVEICPIFQARFDENMRFLFKSREEMEEEDQEVIKSINETPAQKAAKRRKLSKEAQEAEDLRKRLEVVDDEDDDVFIEATPLAKKTMFEKPDKQDAVWKNQRSVHGLALVKSWKLLTLCGVHIITLSTVQLILLVERRYPLSRFTLEQLVNVTRLQVEEESEISLELLRFTRQ